MPLRELLTKLLRRQLPEAIAADSINGQPVSAGVQQQGLVLPGGETSPEPPLAAGIDAIDG
jgi:hypothetical protein